MTEDHRRPSRGNYGSQDAMLRLALSAAIVAAVLSPGVAAACSTYDIAGWWRLIEHDLVQDYPPDENHVGKMYIANCRLKFESNGRLTFIACTAPDTGELQVPNRGAAIADYHEMTKADVLDDCSVKIDLANHNEAEDTMYIGQFTLQKDRLTGVFRRPYTDPPARGSFTMTRQVEP